MSKKKNVKDINIGDKVLLSTGFEYVVTFITDKSILIQRGGPKFWIPKTLVEIYDSMLSISGYRLFKLKDLPEWFMTKNNIE